MFQVVAHRVGERSCVVERHEPARAGGEHVLRVPVRRRHDRAAGGDCEGQRAGGDLLATAVGSHEHVGVGEEVRELVDREEAVVELDVLAETELEDPALEHEAVALALPMRDVGMRPPGDHVDDLRMALDDRRQCFDRRLQSLAGRDQSERRQSDAPARARSCSIE